VKIHQYRPAFFVGFENYVGELGSLAELHALEFLQGIQTDPDFYRFSLHRHYVGDIHMLLAELSQGRKWWVMAYLEGSDLEPFNELPEWQPPERDTPQPVRLNSLLVSEDIDLHAKSAGRCFKRHLPKGSRFLVLLIEPDGNGYALANLPQAQEELDKFFIDFSAKFNFAYLTELKVIQIIP
jgi:hypothetical protein